MGNRVHFMGIWAAAQNSFRVYTYNSGDSAGRCEGIGSGLERLQNITLSYPSGKREPLGLVELVVNQDELERESHWVLS